MVCYKFNHNYAVSVVMANHDQDKAAMHKLYKEIQAFLWLTTGPFGKSINLLLGCRK